MITVAMVLTPFFVFPQVKQVIKVVNFDTKQPIVGATTTLFGQTLTTNAQGVAVAILPAEKKGAFLPIDYWKLDGYVYIGRTEESLYKFFQTKDTLKIYMVELPAYRREMDSISANLFRFRFQNEVLPSSQAFRDSLKSNPDQAMMFADNLIEAAFEDVSNVEMCRSDASVINRFMFYEYDKPAYREILQVLRSGDVNRAVAMAKEHVHLDDNSPENLDWISFYLALRNLDLASDDESPLYLYSEVLYRNHYKPNSTANYIDDLSRYMEYAKADSIINIEKPNNKDPRYAASFIPSFVQYMSGKDNAKLKAVSEEILETTRKNNQDYPCRTMLSGLFWSYKNLYYTYLILEDSVSATRAVDSAIATLNRYAELYSEAGYPRNQLKIRYYQYLLDVLTTDLRFVPQETVYQLYDGIYNAAHENYLENKDNLLLKVQLAECALRWLKNAPEVEGAVEKRTEVLQQLEDLELVLSKEFPEYYAVQNVQVSSQLLGNCLVNQCGSEKLQEAFRNYERSFDEVNALYPKTYIGHYLRYNSILDGYLAANQQFALASELSAFTDRLLSMKVDNDPQQMLVEKANYANEMAESLYRNEMYEESVAYYLEANEMYRAAVAKDEQLWIPYLRNYLQMGDAYLYQNQYDRAVMTYQKILDFEPQIPAAVTPQYVRMKGNVYYYIGDVYKATGEMSNAEKSYKTAEKFFKKAVSLGDLDAYQSLGEMYWGKAVMAAQNKDMKKCRQMIASSVDFYEKSDMEVPLNTYLRAKSVMADFYQEEKDAENYYRTIAGLTDYYEKFAGYGRDYAVGLIQNAETMLNSGRITNEDALRYAHDLLNGVIYLNDAGEDVRLAVLRGSFTLAKAYVANDSVQQAIDIYRDCLKISEIMYADTAMDTHKGNQVEIYSQLIKCYELMAEEIDTAHSELWYYRTLDTRDTLIDLMKELASDGDVNRTYRAAVQYKNNAMVFYKLDMIPSAQDYLDKSIELLKMLYNSEYKTEVEEDLILHYYLKGVIYEEKDNQEKALENLRIAVDYGEKADTSEGVSRYYFMAVNDLLELLEKDKAANAAEIAKLTKTQKSLKKLF